MRKKKSDLTEKEEEIMHMLWNHGPQFVKELVERYPDPKPHFNTVSTFIRILEKKGHVGHEAIGAGYRYYAISKLEDVRRRTFGTFEKLFQQQLFRCSVQSCRRRKDKRGRVERTSGLGGEEE